MQAQRSEVPGLALGENYGARDLMESCVNCIFYRDEQCHRFPPIAGATAFIFPSVDGSDWCGEWETIE
jgi:hypothetical protein